jgi:DNA-binding LacI/PurR family transcriptional regulator
MSDTRDMAANTPGDRAQGDGPPVPNPHAEPATKQARRPHRVTSFDVAAEAGVSQSTVSRALAGDPMVSEGTRARVVAAAHRLNYHIDENAARLRTGKTGTLAVVVITRPGESTQDFNPFYYALLGNICAAASRRGYETLVSFQDLPERLWGRYQEQRKADGLIVLGTNENGPAWEYFRGIADAGAHLVCWGSPFDDLDWVRSYNDAGARMATSHLIAAGYQRIVCIGSQNSPQRQFQERYAGYAAQLAEAGMAPQLVEIEEGLPREEQGRRAVASLLAAGARFDAIFAVCDEMALGALHALREAGVAVPADVGVVGFDGIRAGAHATPSLTSVAPDFAAAGAMMVDRLLATIAGTPGAKTRVPVRLLPRASSRR